MRQLEIPEEELEERFIRASGPGGQNVNKVASAVQLRFDVARSGALPLAVKTRLKRLAGRRMTKTGVLLIEASRFRDQARNRADARARLAVLLEKAKRPPTPRRVTKVSRAQKKKRLEAKRRRGEVKAGRGRLRSLDAS